MQEGAEKSATQGPSLFSEWNVLLVDDNKVNQFLGKRILSNLGVTSVEVASSGEEAFAKAGSRKFDVILTDVEMPGMTGYQLCEKIRSTEHPSHRHVIIALTANASDEDRANAAAAGIDDYLTKPYSPQDLLDVLIKNASTARPLVMEEISEGREFGIEKVYAVFNHQETDVVQFLRMLQQQLPALVQEIKDGMINGQMDISFNAAHKLKSPVKLLANPDFCDRFAAFTESLRYPAAPVPASVFSEYEQELSSIMMLINAEVERKQ